VVDLVEADLEAPERFIQSAYELEHLLLLGLGDLLPVQNAAICADLSKVLQRRRQLVERAIYQVVRVRLGIQGQHVIGNSRFKENYPPDQIGMGIEVFLQRQIEPVFLQLLPVFPDIFPFITHTHAGRKFFLQRFKSLGNLCFPGGKPGSHLLVAIDQPGRNPTVVLYGLYDFINRPDQRKRIQFLLRSLYPCIEAGIKAVHHHGDCAQQDQPQKREFPEVTQAVHQGNGRGKE